MEIRPIRSQADSDAAVAEIERLWDADPGTDAGDMLIYLIEEGGHTQAELAELLGSRSRASEILNRRRALTVEMIHRLNAEWKIPAELLIRPYRLKAA